MSHASLRKKGERELPLPVFHQLGLNSVRELGGSWGPRRHRELRAVPRFPCALVPVAGGAPTASQCSCCTSSRSDWEPRHRVPEPGGLSARRGKGLFWD